MPVGMDDIVNDSDTEDDEQPEYYQASEHCPMIFLLFVSKKLRALTFTHLV